MYQGVLVPLYCFSLFSPTLVANLGYTAATAQLMSVPPYAVAAVVTIGAGFLSDRLQRRGILTLGFSTLGMIGYLMLLVSTNTNVQYAGLFLAASGVYPLIPLIISWTANNSGGSTKKATATGIIISVGNAGGIVSSCEYWLDLAAAAWKPGTTLTRSRLPLHGPSPLHQRSRRLPRLPRSHRPHVCLFDVLCQPTKQVA